MKKADIVEFFSRLAADNPHPETELESVNDYTLLVAVVLSAQATDAGVNKATRALFRDVDTPEKMVALGEEGLKRHIKTIGLFNTKAKNVIALSKTLIRDHAGKVRVRETLSECLLPGAVGSKGALGGGATLPLGFVLAKLPGVGRKTANVVMNVAFGAETFAVDTHIFRVSNRTRLAPGKTPLAVEKKLEKAVPQPFRLHAHHWLILHGRYICKARTPECWRCPVADLCPYEPKTPAPKGRKQTLGAS